MPRAKRNPNDAKAVGDFVNHNNDGVEGFFRRLFGYLKTVLTFADFPNIDHHVAARTGAESVLDQPAIGGSPSPSIHGGSPPTSIESAHSGKDSVGRGSQIR